MAKDALTELSGHILEEEVQLTLTELSSACCVETRYIIELVEEGVIDPLDPKSPQWVFRGSCLKRVRTAVRLQQDLGVNLPGVAVALELIQQRNKP